MSTQPAPMDSTGLRRQRPPLVLVRFTHSSPPYNVGDQAGFTSVVARRLLAAGVADLVNPPSVAIAPAPKPQAKTKPRKRPAKATRAPRNKMVDTGSSETTKGG